MLAINSWRKLQQLSRSELTLLVRALLLLPLMAVFVKLLGFRKVYSAIAPSQNKKYNSKQDKEKAYAIARMVRVASHHGIYQPNCLQKSLVLWWLLQDKGIKSNLRIGVRKQEGGLEAHAWVEHQGDVLNDRSDVSQHFAPFASAIEPAGVKTP